MEQWYSSCHLVAIQIELTTFTLLINGDSAEQFVNSLQLTVICMNWNALIGECILCFDSTFRYINILIRTRKMSNNIFQF